MQESGHVSSMSMRSASCAWLESESTTYLENRQLRKGGEVNTLTPGVFKASSLVIERILADVKDHEAEAAEPDAFVMPPAGVGTLSQHNPFVIRTPNGSLGFYGNPAAGHKIDVDAMATNRLAEARRVDPMPDPERSPWVR